MHVQNLKTSTPQLAARPPSANKAATRIAVGMPDTRAMLVTASRFMQSVNAGDSPGFLAKHQQTGGE